MRLLFLLPLLFLLSCSASGNTAPAKNNTEAAARVHYLDGEAAFKIGDIQKAISEWEETLRLKPDSAYTSKRLAQARAALSAASRPPVTVPAQATRASTHCLSDLTDEVAFRWRGPHAWVGMRFIFLPAEKSFQHYGYMEVHHGTDLTLTLPYDKYVGRVARVTAIRYESLRSTGGVYYVSLRMEDDGEQLTGNAYDTGDKFGTDLMELGPADEITQAKARFVGKTLYPRTVWLQTTDAATGVTASFKVPRYSPLVITDVGPGSALMGPVRLFVKTPSGRTGYVDTTCSGTNTSATPRQIDERSYSQLIDVLFIDHDLRAEHPDWSTAGWEAIENYRVIAGMTTEQAGLAVSKPDSLRRTENSERWEYSGNRFIHFQNGKIDTFSF